MGYKSYAATVFNRWSVFLAVVAALLAFTYGPSRNSPSTVSPSAGAKHVPNVYVQGKNNTALFLVCEHPGLSNVHLATAQSLLEQHPDVHIHFASFPQLEKRLNRLSTLSQARQPNGGHGITFHTLTGGIGYGPAMRRALGENTSDYYDADGLKTLITPPGKAGLNRLTRDMQYMISPWTAEEHLAIYQEVVAIIENVDPAVIVLDTMMNMGVEAAREHNRLHAFVTPNTLVDNFKTEQPRGEIFWKFPALGSGFPFPVPWSKIPLNMYLNYKLIATILNMPNIAAKRTFLLEKGISEPIKFFGLHRNDAPWITQNTINASIPITFVPPNVTSAGPMTISPAAAEPEDFEMINWIKQKPTVLVNLGTGHEYSLGQSKEFIAAMELLLLQSPDIQILWKYKVAKPFEDKYDWKEAMRHLVETERVKVSTWLNMDPPSLMQTGYIVASVTHGGAGGYHESLEAGVPQIVLPQWVDHYNFAQLTEEIGVGVWACRETAPLVTGKCLSDAILRVADTQGEQGRAIAATAKAWGEKLRARPGRDVSAGIIAQLAGSGYVVEDRLLPVRNSTVGV